MYLKLFLKIISDFFKIHIQNEKNIPIYDRWVIIVSDACRFPIKIIAKEVNIWITRTALALLLRNLKVYFQVLMSISTMAGSRNQLS